MGVRVLIVGESHYIKPGEVYTVAEQRRFTADVVRDWGAEATESHRFFSRVYRAFNEETAGPSSAAFRDFWNSLFFYNYVQTFVLEGERPTDRMFADSSSAFHGVLDEIAPEAVVVMSAETWKHMGNQNGEFLYHAPDALGDVWSYRHKKGQCMAAHTHHPSRFSPNRWRPRILAFLNDVREFHT